MTEDDFVKSVMRKYCQYMKDWQIRICVASFLPNQKQGMNYQIQGKSCSQIVVDELHFNRPKFASIIMRAIYDR